MATDNNFTIYSLGKKIPGSNSIPGQTSSILIIENGFFLLHTFLPAVTPSEAEAFSHAIIQYGVYSDTACCILIISVGKAKVVIESPINFSQYPSENLQEWLSRDGNDFKLILADANTNIIQAMRVFAASPEFVSDIKRIAMAQRNIQADVINKLNREVLQLNTTGQLIQRTKFYATSSN